MRVLVATITVVACIGLGGRAVDARQGDDCREVVRATASVSGTSVFAKVRAREKALGQWRERVSERYGSGFYTWLKAHDKTVNCNASSERTTCTAEAFPCGHF